MYEKLAQNLKNNIQIMEETFSANNLRLLNYSVKPAYDDGACEILIEIELLPNKKIISNGLCIKVNLYKNNNEIYAMEQFYIDTNKFLQHDTQKIFFDETEILKKVSYGKIYVTRC